ncbi:hypothetical protein HQ535_03660 [bacterium]|nr:hypothetical protein [bacterium]
MHRGVLVTGLVTAVITIATAGPTAAQDATVSPGGVRVATIVGTTGSDTIGWCRDPVATV